MSRENDQRVKIASVGVAVGVMGALLGGGLSGPLYEYKGPFFMALILGSVGFIAGELTLFGINEQKSVSESISPDGFLKALNC